MQCSKCGFVNPNGFAFCGTCGTPLGATPTLRTLEERKVVTILFADLVGSTPLGEHLDPERTRAIMTRFFQAMAEVIRQFGGTVEKFIGDEVMAVFGLPAAHEDDPHRAIRAAAAMHQRLEALNTDLQLGDAPLQMRIGINTGEVVANPSAAEKGEFMVTGDAVNVAARLRAAAAPHSTLVGERTVRHARSIAQFRERGRITVKGREEPVPAWELADLQPNAAAEPAARTPLVGREMELALLRGLLDKVARDRRVHLVTILGMPGVGKTRLFEEVLLSRHDLLVRRGRSLPYGTTSLWAVAEIVRGDCGILRTDDAGTVAAKLRSRVKEVVGPAGAGGEAAQILAQLSRLLALPSIEDSQPLEESRDNLFWALRRYFKGLASGQPTVVVFEDLHSADAELLDLIEHLATIPAPLPLLIACLARPELLERRSGWGGGKRNYTALSLEPLAEEHMDRLVAGLLGTAEPPHGLRDLLQIAAGNPFFAEETLRMLVDAGALVSDEGTWRVQGPIRVAIPDTVQGVVAARLDQLASQEKAVLLEASVLGKDFWTGALAHLTRRDGRELGPVLETLAAKGLITEQARSKLQDQREFTFKHLIIRDVAYGMLPKTRRAEQHAAFGEWLERLVGERAGEFAELLAFHWHRAFTLWREVGVVVPDVCGRKALQFRLLAGRKAALVHANDQVAAHFEAARALAEELHDDAARAAALEGLADVHVLRAEWSAASRLYQEALDFHLGKGDVVGQAKVQSRMGSAFSGIFDFRRALPHIQSALTKLQTKSNEPELATIYVQMARTQSYLGNLAEAERFARSSLAVAERYGLRAAAAEAHGMIGWAKTVRGDPGAAADEALYIQVAEELGDLRRLIHACGARAFRLRVRGEYEECEVSLHRALDLSEQTGNRARMALNLWSISEIEILRGHWERAQSHLRQYLALTPDVTSWIEHVRSDLAFLRGDLLDAVAWAERAVRTGTQRQDVITQGLAMDWHVILCLRAGQPREGAEVANSALAYFAPLGVFWPAYLHPLAAEAALALGDLTSAAEHCRRAEAYRWTELRPSLARMSRARGRLAAAHRQWDDAVNHLRDALTMYEALDQPLEQAETLEAIAAAEEGRAGPGDAGQAEADLRRAQEIHQRIAAFRLEAQLQESPTLD